MKLIIRREQDKDSPDMSDGGPYGEASAQDRGEGERAITGAFREALRAMESSDESGARGETAARGPERGNGSSDGSSLR